ncbi:MAG: hypothetical protein AAGG01_20360 [Planctomycetota bacterium]
MKSFIRPSLAALAIFAMAPAASSLPAVAAPQGNDLIVPSGSTIVYNTATGSLLQLDRFIIEPNARFVVTGPAPLRINAARVQIDGILSANGVNSSGVGSLNTTNIPEPGALGGPGGGAGGTGSPQTNASSPSGTNGDESYGIVLPGIPLGAGQGGETGFAPFGAMATENRRGAGGGGGALARNQPVTADPFAPENLGLIALPGMDGGPNGTGAISGNARAQGGEAGLPVFQDATSDNDFWGTKLGAGSAIIGEVRRPLPGRGGGAGGDAVASATFPNLPFSPFGDEKGAGGGGGGGLIIIVTRTFELGAQGQLTANGGAGGGGENVVFFDRVGGGSGGGSGGWIVVDAGMIDLADAADDAIMALGGAGGPGRQDRRPGTPFGNDIPGAGGTGGPGVIQLHVPSGDPADILLPPGKTVGDLTTPEAHVLLPVLGG